MPFNVQSRGAAAAILACLGLAGQSVLYATAAEGVWPVEGRLLGEPRGTAGDAKKAKDVSGIACATELGFPRVCVVADDSSQGAQIVVLYDGRLVAGDFIRLTDASLDGDLLELDAEAVAYAEGAFYVMGSHGRPRHRDGGAGDAKTEAKTAARRHLFRVTFDVTSVDTVGRLAKPATVKRSLTLSDVIRAEPILGPSFDGALAGGGVDIEGAAIRGGRLYAGLRGPILPSGEAVILSVPLDVLFDGAAGQAKLHRLDLGDGRGIRDLVAFKNGFLVLGGPLKDPSDDAVASGDYVVRWWDGAASRPLGVIPAFGRKVKPEALVPLDQADGRLRLLVLFDGPPEGGPRVVLIEAP
ncbi:MAG: DUF3616 domain-containing protein [Methylobacterium sp.]|uniref:DUF3616 domain-containing protein n=1 Tax=Methylobacterium sp. TaxID=409 RepID=UPI0025F8279F|nr:DUF3616 domain-containing protein [Methylobacterium sp.]MBX9932097.1 DUF3616 domain-containing protein [Methylobacterium sp.]